MVHQIVFVCTESRVNWCLALFPFMYLHLLIPVMFFHHTGSPAKWRLPYHLHCGRSHLLGDTINLWGVYAPYEVISLAATVSTLDITLCSSLHCYVLFFCYTGVYAVSFLAQVAKTKINREIFIGGTSILTPKSFIEVLRDMPSPWALQTANSYAPNNFSVC